MRVVAHFSCMHTRAYTKPFSRVARCAGVSLLRSALPSCSFGSGIFWILCSSEKSNWRTLAAFGFWCSSVSAAANGTHASSSAVSRSTSL